MQSFLSWIIACFQIFRGVFQFYRMFHQSFTDRYVQFDAAKIWELVSSSFASAFGFLNAIVAGSSRARLLARN